MKNGSTANKRSAADMKDWYKSNKKRVEYYEKKKASNPDDALKQLRDVNKNATKNISSYNKDSVISYLKNLGSNEKNLRSLSRYLYFRSQVYSRLVNFYASMFELDARSVIPQYDILKTVDSNQLLKSYVETLNQLEIIDPQHNLRKMLNSVFREDAAFAVYWLDNTGFTIIPIDPDYAKIDGVYNYGNFSWSMDMTWFRSRQDILEFWGEPFTSMYNAYKEKGGSKWQHVPDDHSFCLKYRVEDYDIVVPPILGTFLQLISLEDLADLQSVQDKANVYKLVYKKMKTRSGANSENEFEVDPKFDEKYFDFLSDILPDYVSAALIPGSDDLGVLNFDNDAASDSNKITKATEALLNLSGGAEVLNGASISSSAAFDAAQIANTNFAVSPLLPQIEGWTNMVLAKVLKNPCKVRYFKTSSYTIRNLKKDFLEAAQNGMPTKLAYNTLNGFSEKDTLALNALENALNIPSILQPLSTSYTQTGNEAGGEGTDPVSGGRPKKDNSELSSSGDRSRNNL